MKLNTLLKEIVAELDKPQKDIDLQKMQSKMFAVAGLLSDEEVKITGKLFDLFPEEYKRAAMMLFLQMIAQALTD